jgi:hypothetical protein
MRFAPLVFLSGTVSGVVLVKKQPWSQGKFGDSDDAYVDDAAERNAMFDCANGVKAAVGATGGSNDMAMRIVAAKAAAIGDQEEGATHEDFKGATKSVQKFRRHAGQDCEEGGETKKDMEASAPYMDKVNFSGPGSAEADAQAMAEEALDRVKGIKEEYFTWKPSM